MDFAYVETITAQSFDGIPSSWPRCLVVLLPLKCTSPVQVHLYPGVDIDAVYQWL